MVHVHHPLPRSEVHRERYILDRARGLRVLHVGAADAPYTWDALANGTWLHSKLSAVAGECLGVDIDEPTVARLRQERGITNLRVANCETLDPADVGTFDLVVAGEVIEHLDNPGLFLDGVRRVVSPTGHLLITTINAFCLRRLVRIPTHIESVHPDHTYYFSHRTLSTLVERHGFAFVEGHGYRVADRSFGMVGLVEGLAGLISPNLLQGLVHLYRPVVSE